MAKKRVICVMPLLFVVVMSTTRFSSSFVFPLRGNVYPDGDYYTSVVIGDKHYSFDIDTGSDLTWVECDDSDQPCTGCTQPPESRYVTHGNYVPIEDPLCRSIDSQGTDRCEFEVDYADGSRYSGVLVHDYFHLQSLNGSVAAPSMTFGCGYHQENPSSNSSPTAGVLALGKGSVTIVSQLRNMGLITRDVIGHCLSRLSGLTGFLFIGDYLVYSSLPITWTPMSNNFESNHYSSGPAELLFGGNFTGWEGLKVIFDSGSSYTYFNSEVYESLVDLVRRDLNGKPFSEAPEDSGDLPICWKGPKPYKYVDHDVKRYFKPLALRFTQANNVELQLKPEDYLTVTKEGNVCLGILNGREAGLGSVNLIGDISMQDKMVIYDNDNQRIGWVPANCAKVPSVDDNDYIYKDELR